MNVSEYIIGKAKELSRDRMRAFEWLEEDKYDNNSYRSNVVGSIGEICAYKMLYRLGLRGRRLFYKFTGYDKGDLRIGDLYMEIKTRTVWDWEKYGSRSPLKQVDKYRERKINLIYVWVTYDKNNERIYISGFNYLSDFTKVFLDGKNYSTSTEKVRGFGELLRLCFKSQINELNKHVLYKKAYYIGRKSNKIQSLLPPRQRYKSKIKSTITTSIGSN